VDAYHEKLFAVWCLLIPMLAFGSCVRHHGMYRGEDGGEHIGASRMERGIKDMETVVDRTLKDPHKATQVKATMHEILRQLQTSHERSRECINDCTS
jgi:hypothetical protein